MTDEFPEPPEGPTEFGATPPPADGSTQPCPSCRGGYIFAGGVEEGEMRCFDCYGSGVQGDGWKENRDDEWWRV